MGSKLRFYLLFDTFFLLSGALMMHLGPEISMVIVAMTVSVTLFLLASRILAFVKFTCGQPATNMLSNR